MHLVVKDIYMQQGPHVFYFHSNLTAQGRESGMQWSFSNNSSNSSQYLFFKAAQEARPWKNLDEQVDSNLRSCANGAQMVMVLDKLPGTNHPLQHNNSHPISPFKPRMFPSPSQPKQSRIGTVSHPVLHSHIFTASSPQQLGLPVLPPAANLPTAGFLMGSSDLLNGSKQSEGGPVQLTIFYDGSVNVFDDVIPEQAQAIMLLAGNGGTPIINHKTTATEVSGTLRKSVNGDMSHGKEAFLGLPTTISVSSMVVSPSQENLVCKLELATPIPAVALESPITQQEPPTRRAVHSLVSSSIPLFSSVALPQAKKASLARFLEKRKERVTSTSPYPASKRSPQNSISKVSSD
ncbi:hypothetical protein SAY86_004047 [Trapa natans]|uniref:Protein TIFY n=1 Tax=Trapa natans TaxID=22666 RepID=A0AAN7RIH8_TRANT|nr:hypothetical protein SAY86_004047 [Trapa natans]